MIRNTILGLAAAAALALTASAASAHGYGYNGYNSYNSYNSYPSYTYHRIFVGYPSPATYCGYVQKPVYNKACRNRY